jgi:hypothetical protein
MSIALAHFASDKIPCPNCKTEIKSTEMFDGFHIHDNHMCFSQRGVCPKCHKIYTWIDHFVYAGYTDVEEENIKNL